MPDPGAGNVGPTKRCTALTPSGSITVSTAGTTVSNLNVTGTIAVNAANVTINNVCVTDDAEGNVNNGPAVRFNASGGLIEHSTVRGANATNESVEQAVASENNSNETAEYDYFYNCGECVHDKNWTVSNSYIYVNGSPFSGGYPGGKPSGEADHNEGLYMTDGAATMSHDTILLPRGEVAAAVFADNNSGSHGTPCTNRITVTNSLIAGGGFLLYQCPDASSLGTASLTFTGNRVARCTSDPIVQVTSEAGSGGYQCKGNKTYSNENPLKDADSHGYFPYGGFYGIDSYTFCPPTPGQTWVGNVWDDNRTPVRCQHG